MKSKLADYNIKNQIGKGTSGQIFKVVHNTTGKTFALKIAQVSPKRKNETEFLKKIGTHSHIVKLHDSFTDQQQIFLILDYYPYGDVLKYLKIMHRPLNETEAKKWIYQIISGVKHLHSNGIVHRDIKLENLVLFISEPHKDKENLPLSQLKPEHFSVALIDFDLASTWSSDKYLEKSCGSPFYASPEIFRGTPYSGPEVDMWSVGVVLYCMIANAFPFFGTNILEIAFKVQKGVFTKPRWISAELSSFLDGLLNINRMERLSAQRALEHPWFADIHKKNNTTNLNAPSNDIITLQPPSAKKNPSSSSPKNDKKKKLKPERKGAKKQKPQSKKKSNHRAKKKKHNKIRKHAPKSQSLKSVSNDNCASTSYSPSSSSSKNNRISPTQKQSISDPHRNSSQSPNLLFPVRRSIGSVTRNRHPKKYPQNPQRFHTPPSCSPSSNFNFNKLHSYVERKQQQNNSKHRIRSGSHLSNPHSQKFARKAISEASFKQKRPQVDASRSEETSTRMRSNRTPARASPSLALPTISEETDNNHELILGDYLDPSHNTNNDDVLSRLRSNGACSGTIFDFPLRFHKDKSISIKKKKKKIHRKRRTTSKSNK